MDSISLRLDLSPVLNRHVSLGNFFFAQKPLVRLTEAPKQTLCSFHVQICYALYLYYDKTRDIW